MATLEFFWKFYMKNLFFYFSYNVLPCEVKETINCNSSTFNKYDLKISIKHTGPEIPIFFHCVFCEYCETNTLSKLLNKYKEDLREPANFSNLIANWDVLNIQNHFCDFVGFLLPCNEDVIARPNSLRLIKRPTDHASTTHPYTAKSERSKSLKKKSFFKVNFFNARPLLWILQSKLLQIKLPSLENMLKS